MKVSSISVGNTGPKDERTMEQFVDSELAKTPLGLLLLALAAETTWSSEYTIDAFLYGDQPGLRITHPAFIAYQQLTILDEDKICTIRGVEDAVRKHFRDAQKKMEADISPLRRKVADMHYASRNIAMCKAKAAIVAVFPEAADTQHSSSISDGSFCCFIANKNGIERFFVVREIDHEFVGGIAQLNISSLGWYRVDYHKKYYLFWESLARAFAARALQIPENQMCWMHTASEEKSLDAWASVPYGPYVVKKVSFRLPDGPFVDVEFGSDNLPAKVTLVPKPHVA